jgi:glycine cleavage system H lipoate-binding protein
VNSDPYGAGWFFKLKLSASGEAVTLLSPADYSKQIGQ